MGNSSRPIGQLNITGLSLAGDGAWPDLHVETLTPQLNVFYGPPRAGKSSVAQLVGHLLYGKSESAWRQQFGQTVSTAAGSLQLDGSPGNFVLRRHHDADRRDKDRHNAGQQWRLTISSDQGDSVDSQTVRDLLSGLSPKFASQLFFVDFAESPRVDWLLNENFAREFSGSRIADKPQLTSRQYSCYAATQSSIVDRVDRRRVDELVKQRDAIAGEIQQQLSVRRRESEVLQGELSEVESTLARKRERSGRLQAQLHSLEIELAELEARLRYFSLDRYSKVDEAPLGMRIDVKEKQRELGELDNEISRCRQSLAELQQRENLLRTELAQYSPDGTADRVTCLADGRTTLGVLEQLLDDLDAEVSQLARASEPGYCLGHGSHAKLSPVAALLRQQVYTLCGQLTEHERIVKRQQLSTESRQLLRVHSALGERLDLLLSRREALVAQSQLAGQPARLIPQSPAAEFCHCRNHGNFVQSGAALEFGGADRGRDESESRRQLNVLQHERTQLIDELSDLAHDIEQLQQRWKNVQRERGGLIGGASIDDKKGELERLESVIHQSIEATEPGSRSNSISHWRASDILAQLTDGHLVQIRLERQQSQTAIVDRHGQRRFLENLSATEHDQLYLALTLSLVSSYAQRGVHLPLILDEPFLQQDAAETAAMAGVLDEFSRAGHQLLVFTEDREAKRRFATLSATLFDLEGIRRTNPTNRGTSHTTSRLDTDMPLATESLATKPSPAVQMTGTRIIRETHDGQTTPVLRLATVDGESKQEEIFYLTENSSFGEFPVLGAETSTLFQHVNICSIGDLLAADSATIAQQLDRDGITTETVQLWQIHMSLMCHVPNLTLDDAQVLAANGIESPEDLFEVEVESLLRSIEGFLRSDPGRPFERASGHYTRSCLGRWRAGARRYRDRWQRSSRRYSGWQSRRSSRRGNSSPQPEERPPIVRKNRRPRKFHLSRAQDVEDAPSIGPKTATRLAKVGIRTIADLLHADPESTAGELDVNHISAATIAAWQHQSRLVCQIPELRGYAAQLLVACGLTQPQQIANTAADELVSQILSFCQTKEGQRVLRSGDAPKREKIARWIDLATHSRPLEAA